MKIVIVSPYYYPSVGGVQNYVKNITKGLKTKYEHKIVIITSNHNKNKYEEKISDGIKIYFLPFWFKISNTPINPLWYFQIRKIIKQEKPNIINAHTPVPFISDIAARVCGNIPFVLTYHGDLIKENSFLNFLCKLYYYAVGNNTLKISDKIIATSEYYAHNSIYLNKYIKKLGIVSPGVDMRKFNLKVNKNYLKNKYRSQHIVLFVGQLDKTHTHKGLNYLLDAIQLVKKDIKDVKLLVVGKGDNIINYKNYAKKLYIKQNVIFTRYISDISLPKFYAGSDVTVLPSSDNAEGFGMVLIEAGACGTPVIGTNVGGIPFVISDQLTGFIVPPKNPEALKKALVRILSNKILAKTMGNNGYNKIKNIFEWNTSVQTTDTIFKEISGRNIPKI